MATPLPFSYQRFLAAADAAAPRFHARTRPMQLPVSSLLFSDALCVCALCDLFAVDHLLESGTGFGGSTEMFARYFEPEGAVRVISLDWHAGWWRSLLGRLGAADPDARDLWPAWRAAKGRARARARLGGFNGVELRRGDARVALPDLARELAARGARIGVFVDGPKREGQLQLAQQLLDASPQVCFAALDDIGPRFDDGRRYERFKASPYAAFATTEHGYFQRFASVNAGRLPKALRAPDHQGRGLGVLVNTKDTKDAK